jgi:predicted transcriptional regulator of viral defense system
VLIATILTQKYICVILVTMKTLPNQLLRKPFSTEEAVALGINKTALIRMVKAGTLERLSWGVYQLSDAVRDGRGLGDGSGLGTGSGSGASHGDGSGGNEYSEQEKMYIVAALRCGPPSAICLLSALEHYHVTDVITQQVWVLVPASKRVISKDLKLVRSRNPQWDVGILKTKDYWITTIERSLVDCLLHRHLVGYQVALAALKQALAQKKVKLGQVYDVANSLGIAHRIRPVIEALGS